MANVGGFRGNGITLYIAGDTRGLDKALKQATNDVNTFARNSEKAGKKAQAAQAGLFGGSGFRGSKTRSDGPKRGAGSSPSSPRRLSRSSRHCLSGLA